MRAKWLANNFKASMQLPFHHYSKDLQPLSFTAVLNKTNQPPTKSTFTRHFASKPQHNSQFKLDVSKASSLLFGIEEDENADETQDIPINEKLKRCQEEVSTQVKALFTSLLPAEVMQQNETKGEQDGTVGFALEVKKSSIQHPKAGNGVFVASGKISRGKVVAIYPGEAILPLAVSEIIRSGESKKFKELFGSSNHPNVYKIQRFDRMIINAKRLVQSSRGKKEKDASKLTLNEKKWADLRKVVKSNPFAVGHLVNHPPAGALPNVMICPFNFPKTKPIPRKLFDVSEKDMAAFDFFQRSLYSLLSTIQQRLIFASTRLRDGPQSNDSFPNALLQFVPNIYQRRPGFFDNVGSQQSVYRLDYSDIHVPSLVFIATKDIQEGEELFVNYRFSPSATKLPDWYQPVDIEEAARRWKK